MSSSRNCIGCDEEPGNINIQSSFLVLKMFSEVTSIVKVKDDDKLCKNCQKELKACYIFRKRVLEIRSLYETPDNNKTSVDDKAFDHTDGFVEQVFLNEDEPVKQEKEANFDVELLDEEQETDEDGNWGDEDMSQDSDEYKPEITHDNDQNGEEANEEWSPNSRFKCKNCNKSFAKRSALTTHELSHLNLRNHTCPRSGCNSAFNVLYRLLRHMRNVHNAEENEIEVVKETSRQIVPIRTPEKDAKLKLKVEKTLVKCEVCLKVLSNVKYLKEHMTLQHLNNAPYVCDEKGCGKKFTDWSLLEKHQKKHEGKFEYNCNYCEKGFVQRKVLNQHLKKSHQISQEEINEIQRNSGTCSVCGCFFKSSQKLSEHRAFTHGIGEKFVCDQCGKIFFSKIVLTSHQKYHQQDFKKKKCLKCPSTFTEEKGLKTHMRRVHKMSELTVFSHFKNE